MPVTLAGRALDGRLTGTERARVDRLLDRHLTAGRQTRESLTAGAPDRRPADQPEISLMFDVFVLRTRMGAVLTAALAESGLSATEYALLSLLDDLRARTAGELALLLGAAPTTLGRQLAELVRRGWVSRTSAVGDRRRLVFALTADGEQRFRAAIPLASRLAVEIDRSLRQRGTDPAATRAMLQSLSAALRALSP